MDFKIMPQLCSHCGNVYVVLAATFVLCPECDAALLPEEDDEIDSLYLDIGGES